MLTTNKIHCIDAREGLKQLPNGSVDCVVTSPPFWALRDYGKAATTIWDAKPGCKHRWGNPYMIKRSGDEATAGTGNHRAGVGHYVNKSSFCTKCGAYVESKFDDEAAPAGSPESGHPRQPQVGPGKTSPFAEESVNYEPARHKPIYLPFVCCLFGTRMFG